MQSTSAGAVVVSSELEERLKKLEEMANKVPMLLETVRTRKSRWLEHLAVATTAAAASCAPASASSAIAVEM